MGISPHCKKILEQPITKELCYSFRDIRAWVACRAWEKMSDEPGIRFGDAIRFAWTEIKDKCASAGATL